MIKAEKSCKDCRDFGIKKYLTKDNVLIKRPHCNFFKKNLKTTKPCEEYHFVQEKRKKMLNWSIGITASAIGAIAADLLFFPGFNFGIVGTIVAPLGILAIWVNSDEYVDMKRKYGKNWRERL